MELRDGAGLAGAKILQIERAHEVIVAPYVLGYEMDLVDVIELGTFVGPVAMTHAASLLSKTGQHHDDDAPLLPDQLPEIRRSLGKRSLSRYVSWIPRIVISLRAKIKNKISSR